MRTVLSLTFGGLLLATSMSSVSYAADPKVNFTDPPSLLSTYRADVPVNTALQGIEGLPVYCEDQEKCIQKMHVLAYCYSLPDMLDSKGCQ